MGRVNFSPLGSGFRFLNFGRVGFRVFEFYLGLRNFGFGFTSGPSFFFKSYIFELNIRCSTSKSSGYMVQVRQKLPRVKKKILRAGSVPPKNCSGWVILNTISNSYYLPLSVSYRYGIYQPILICTKTDNGFSYWPIPIPILYWSYPICSMYILQE